MSEEFECLGITVNDEEFAGTDLAVEVEFGVGFFIGADDFNDEIGPALQVCAMIDRRVGVQQQDNIRASVVFAPILTAIRDIPARQNVPQSGEAKEFA